MSPSTARSGGRPRAPLTRCPRLPPAGIVQPDGCFLTYCTFKAVVGTASTPTFSWYTDKGQFLGNGPTTQMSSLIGRYKIILQTSEYGYYRYVVYNCFTNRCSEASTT